MVSLLCAGQPRPGQPLARTALVMSISEICALAMAKDQALRRAPLGSHYFQHPPWLPSELHRVFELRR